MKKVRRLQNTEEYNLSEDSETDYRQHVNLVEYVSEAFEALSVNNNATSCMQKDSFSTYEKSKNVCGYCKGGKHSTTDCPLYKNAIEQQNSMLFTYNSSSNNHSKKSDNEIDQQHHELWKRAQKKYYSGHADRNTETETEIDRQNLELVQKAQKEYFSKYCNYCKEYGHLQDKCAVLEKTVDQESEDNWQSFETKKSKKMKKTNTLKTEDDSNCIKEMEEKYCYFCKVYGHTENVCPEVQKALKKKKMKPNTVLPKISNTPTKVKDFIRKIEKCIFCGNSGHKEDNCAEKNQYKYPNKHGCFPKERVQFFKCSLFKGDTEKLENQNHKFFEDGQTLNECNFCGASDHSELECDGKLEYDYISKYCHYCEVYGHSEDTCPTVEQAAKELENQSYCKGSPESSKKVSFSNDVTTLTENVKELKICHVCDEFGHDENDCFVRQQNEFYSKYCDHCKENGHNTNDCTLNKQSSIDSTFSNNFSKKELDVKIQHHYAYICSDHCVCENCHITYSDEKYLSHNVKKTGIQIPLGIIKHRIRYCTLCGIEGLVDTCILKENAATE